MGHNPSRQSYYGADSLTPLKFNGQQAIHEVLEKKSSGGPGIFLGP